MAGPVKALLIGTWVDAVSFERSASTSPAALTSGSISIYSPSKNSVSSPKQTDSPINAPLRLRRARRYCPLNNHMARTCRLSTSNPCRVSPNGSISRRLCLLLSLFKASISRLVSAAPPKWARPSPQSGCRALQARAGEPQHEEARGVLPSFLEEELPLASPLFLEACLPDALFLFVGFDCWWTITATTRRWISRVLCYTIIARDTGTTVAHAFGACPQVVGEIVKPTASGSLCL